MASKQIVAQRRALRWAQGSVCAACCEHLPSHRRLRQFDPDYPTFDHVSPRSAGGKRTLANGLLKHLRCNQKKGSGPPSGCDLIWQATVTARLATRPKSLKPVFKGGTSNPQRSLPVRFGEKISKPAASPPAGFDGAERGDYWRE